MYKIAEHKHIFAAWAASRAASVKNHRFSVEKGKNILEAAGFHKLIEDVENLSLPEDMDTVHKQWREKVIDASKDQELEFTHGVAAKLINCYLKSAFVCVGFEDHSSVQAIHPPIDSLLLDALFKSDEPSVKEQRDAWRSARKGLVKLHL